MARSSAKASPLRLFFHVCLAIHLRAVAAGTAGTAASAAPSASYQPKSGAEERWVAEEEFHGASSSESERRKDRLRKREHGKDPKASFPGHDNFGEHSWWDDEDGSESEDERLLQSPLPSAVEGKGLPKKRRHRLRVWKNSNARKGSESAPSPPTSDGSSAASGAQETSTTDDSSAASEYDEEHPLRTDEWELDVRLSRLYPQEEGDLFPESFDSGTGQISPPIRRGGHRKRQVMQFARNGYVKVLEDDKRDAASSRSKPKVGKWRIGHSGVAFDIPVQVNVRRRKDDKDKMHPRVTVLHYHADIHLNKFGERPRMFRGVITRDRHSSFLPPNFLRPVIGTFSAEGIGRDTADTSYQDRAISLSRQQVINDVRREKQ
ncbi:hypothetical protein ACHAXT_005866 [Thalassiosira profunda]